MNQNEEQLRQITIHLNYAKNKKEQEKLRKERKKLLKILKIN